MVQTPPDGVTPGTGDGVKSTTEAPASVRSATGVERRVQYLPHNLPALKPPARGLPKQCEDSERTEGGAEEALAQDSAAQYKCAAAER